MTIHTAGENGLALFLDADDLALLGSAELNHDTARELVKTTLEEMGFDTGPVEISAFLGKEGAMLVALLGKEKPRPWSFYKLPDNDALLDVWKLAGGYEKKYFRIKNEHYIAFPEQSEPPLINEFGRRMFRPQLYLKHLEEHYDQQ